MNSHIFQVNEDSECLALTVGLVCYIAYTWV